MIADDRQSNGRPLFDEGMESVLVQHATLRVMAEAAKQDGFGAAAIASLAELMKQHETMETPLFDLPFLSCVPGDVGATAERLRDLLSRLTSGPDQRAAGPLFCDALLEHLSVEEAWLGQESERRRQRILSII